MSKRKENYYSIQILAMYTIPLIKYKLENVNQSNFFKNDSLLTWNQSIVQQLIIAGNFLILFLKLSPIGLIARIICNWSLTICTKKLNKATGLPSVCKGNCNIR